MLAKSTGGALVRAGGDTWFFLTADYAFGHALEKDTAAVVTASGGKVRRETAAPAAGQRRPARRQQLEREGVTVKAVFENDVRLALGETAAEGLAFRLAVPEATLPERAIGSVLFSTFCLATLMAGAILVLAGLLADADPDIRILCCDLVREVPAARDELRFVSDELTLRGVEALLVDATTGGGPR